MPTPFGTIYSSNITPDVETGRWPEAAFRRAMRAVGSGRQQQVVNPNGPIDQIECDSFSR